MSPSSNLAVLPEIFREVDIRPALAARPTRTPDYQRENRGFSVLAAEMAKNPRNMLQKLVEVAVELCGAHTAGISLLDGDVFRWEGVAGVFAAARGGTMPRDQSPCGVCVDTCATQLMYLADRCFPALYNEPRFVEALLVPFLDHGTAIGTVWIVSHTDDRKFDAEDERIVRVLTEFASAAWQQWNTLDALAESNLAKDGYIATLAHELRNPFAVILSASDVLRSRVTDATANSAIDTITRQSRHVSRLVEDLIEEARVGSGNITLRKVVVDLRSVVAEAIGTRREQIERRSQRLIVALGSGLMLVEGDAVRLAQVVSNLLDNASKFTPAGGDISITLSAAGDQAHLDVRDTGVGMATAHLEAIFDPFRQLNVLPGSAGRGLGLGLALVKNIVRLHGGGVAATSGGADQGSQFSVHLPLVTL